MNKNVSISSLDAARALSEQIIRWLNQEKERNFYIAVSGGSTPMILFHVWREFYMNEIDWSRLQIYWVDERCVDPRDAESNFGMTKKILLDFVPILPNQAHRIIGEIDPDFAKDRYTKEVLDSAYLENGIPIFDLVLLGVGEDGHTASIFPGQNNLFTTNEIYAVSLRPMSNSVRITMTGKVITHAKHVVFFVTGAPKAKLMQEIFEGDEAAKNYPAYYIAKNSNNVTFFLDEGAGRLLTYP